MGTAVQVGVLRAMGAKVDVGQAFLGSGLSYAQDYAQALLTGSGFGGDYPVVYGSSFAPAAVLAAPAALNPFTLLALAGAYVTYKLAIEPILEPLLVNLAKSIPPNLPGDAVKNPHRDGSWGEADEKGKFKRERWRYDEGRPGIKGPGGKDHVHVDGGEDHLPPGTPYPE